MEPTFPSLADENIVEKANGRLTAEVGRGRDEQTNPVRGRSKRPRYRVQPSAPILAVYTENSTSRAYIPRCVHFLMITTYRKLLESVRGRSRRL